MAARPICLLLTRWRPFRTLSALLEKSLARLITGREYNEHSVEGMSHYSWPGRARAWPISRPAAITFYYLGNAPDTLSTSLSRPRFLLSPRSPSSFPSIFPRTSFIFLPPLIFQSTTNLQLVSEVTEVVLSLLMPALAFLRQRPDLFCAGRNLTGRETFCHSRPRRRSPFLCLPRRRCWLCGTLSAVAPPVQTVALGISSFMFSLWLQVLWNIDTNI